GPVVFADPVGDRRPRIVAVAVHGGLVALVTHIAPAGMSGFLTHHLALPLRTVPGYGRGGAPRVTRPVLRAHSSGRGRERRVPAGSRALDAPLEPFQGRVHDDLLGLALDHTDHGDLEIDGELIGHLDPPARFGQPVTAGQL